MKTSDATTRVMRSGYMVAVVLPLSLLVVACDPGVTIRQDDSPKEIGKPTGVIVRVKSANEFIGTARYATQVTVTNNSEATMLVTGIELATKQAIYTESSSQPQDFPGEILVKQSRDFTVLFRLNDAVYKTFKEPAELRVHYRSGRNVNTARVALVRGSLNDSR